MVAWRDYILRKPVKISLENGEDVWACTKKYENIYLVVDLTKDVGEQGICEIQ